MNAAREGHSSFKAMVINDCNVWPIPVIYHAFTNQLLELAKADEVTAKAGSKYYQGMSNIDQDTPPSEDYWVEFSF